VTTTVSLASVDAKAGRVASVRPDPVFRVVPVARVTGHLTDPRTAGVLPAVVAAVRAAEGGARIPARLTPPPASLPHDWDPWALPRGCVPIAHSYESSSNICRLGARASRKTIVLIGDSHAQQWLPPLLRLAKRDGWILIPLMRPGCLPQTWLANIGLDLCRVWYRWVVAHVRMLRPNVTLVTGALSDAWGAEVPPAVNGLLTLAKAVRRVSGRVAIIGDPEALRRDPVDCLLSRRASLRSCMATWWPKRLEAYDAVERRAARDGVRFLDTRGWFCFDRRCPAVIGRTIVYFDLHHVTAEYALRLSAVFRAEFRRAIAKRPARVPA